jgi:hypothetical protein
VHAVDKALERGWVRRQIVADVVVAEQAIEGCQVVLVNHLLIEAADGGLVLLR